MIDTGITTLGLALPRLALDVRTLAALRDAPEEKFTIGLGCDEFGVCGPDEGVVELASRAAARALARWGGSPDDLGMIAVGTESAVDMSRPLSAFVAEALGLADAPIRSYEVKHACYGGTLALRQAVEWHASGAARGRAALVIAADVARYAPGGPAEPTQGAGAVAMIVGPPGAARVDVASHAWSRPAFDFWRPVGEAYPQVDGPLSIACYRDAARATFEAWAGDRTPAEALAEADALCFHVPFPKMVRKALWGLGEAWGWSDEATAALWHDKVAPTMPWNLRAGNAYTASLWIAVAHALAGRSDGDRLLAFSYGSGCGAELLELNAGPDAAAGAWTADVEADLGARTLLDAATYDDLRAAHG